MAFNIIAYHIENRIDLSLLRNQLNTFQLIRRDHSFLLFQTASDSYLYVKNYGSVVFFNQDRFFIEEMIKKLGLSKDKILNELPFENYTLEFSNVIDVDFNLIKVKEINQDIIHIACLNLSQSVALMNYVNRASDLLNDTLTYIKQLEETGSFKLSKKQMRKFIGKTLYYKNNISEDLFVFDSPNVVWNNKDLSILDQKLKAELEIMKRHNGIIYSLNIIKENLDLFSDIIHHKYSSMLEWIIILLILFEIVQVIIEKIV